MRLSSLSSMSVAHPPPVVLIDITWSQVAHLICSYCLQPYETGVKSFLCSGCRRTSYCGLSTSRRMSFDYDADSPGGPQCQKLDWKVGHKKLCPLFKTVNAKEVATKPTEPLSAATFMLRQVNAESVPLDSILNSRFHDRWLWTSFASR